jgi:hypothetical protein
MNHCNFDGILMDFAYLPTGAGFLQCTVPPMISIFPEIGISPKIIHVRLGFSMINHP